MIREQLQLQIDAIARDCPAPMMPPIVASTVAPEPKEAFGRWLLAQKDRGDWIDDLAIPARVDRQFPKDGNPREVGARLQALGANGDAFEQLEDAERVWASL